MTIIFCKALTLGYHTKYDNVKIRSETTGKIKRFLHKFVL